MPAPGPPDVLIACPNLALDRTLAVDDVAVGRVHRSVRADARGGGKGVNVARALASLGRRATVVGFAAGHTGRAVVGLLRDEGIDVVSVPCDGETRVCMTIVGPGPLTVFNEAGPPIGRAEWERYEASVVERLPGAGMLVCSGSFPPGAPDRAAARLVEAARSAGRASVCDTSGRLLAAALAARPDVVAPNVAEAAGVLSGRRAEPADAGGRSGGLEDARRLARALYERGARAAVVTAGSAGAALAHAGGTRTWPPPQVSVVNTVGAGDALVAGVVDALLDGEAVDAATARGVATGAASCETFAAGVVDARRVAELWERMQRRVD